MVYMAYNLVLFDRIQEKYMCKEFQSPTTSGMSGVHNCIQKLLFYALILTLDVEGSTLGIGLMTGTIDCQLIPIKN